MTKRFIKALLPEREPTDYKFVEIICFRCCSKYTIVEGTLQDVNECFDCRRAKKLTRKWSFNNQSKFV